MKTIMRLWRQDISKSIQLCWFGTTPSDSFVKCISGLSFVTRVWWKFGFSMFFMINPYVSFFDFVIFRSMLSNPNSLAVFGIPFTNPHYSLNLSQPKMVFLCFILFLEEQRNLMFVLNLVQNLCSWRIVNDSKYSIDRYYLSIWTIDSKWVILLFVIWEKRICKKQTG